MDYTDHLYILWTNADVVTSKLMVMMYAKNAIKNQWWGKVTVIAWGATPLLLTENEEIQKEFVEAKSYGVEFTGCIACATELNIVDKLTSMEVELKKWGPSLTVLIKNKTSLITI